MTLFLTIVLRVILIDVPTSTRQPALPSHRTLSLRSYPHYFRSNDISLVYSSSIAEAANRLNQTDSLYPTFVVYFIDYRPPIFLIQRTIQLNKNNLYPLSYGQMGFIFRRLFLSFTKIHKHFQKEK